MAEFEPPSFSLGLDFDLDSEPQTTVPKDPPFPRQPSSNPSFRLIEDDDDFEIPDPPRTLKRLRRGPPSESSSAAAAVAQKWESVEMGCNNVDDEIEEFSSQEDWHRVGCILSFKFKLEAFLILLSIRVPGSLILYKHHPLDSLEREHSSMPYQSGCSSSKFPLHGHGALTKQSASQRQVTKRKEVSSTSASASLETSSNKLLLPKLTVSPLRRFQLIDSDSDSDDPSVSEDANKDTNKVDSSMKEKQCNDSNPSTSQPKRTKASVSVSQTEDLWKDFYTEKSVHIPTPALDEFCEEYFRSGKEKNGDFVPRHDKSKSDNECSNQTFIINNDEHHLGDPIPPAHRYFFHNDPRIQKLVSSRLSYFFPLGAIHNSANKHFFSSVIDYRSQFSQGEGSKHQAAGTSDAETSSRRGRKNSKKSAAEVEGSESWVNPKSSRGIPKDAGKRRVHADGQSGGHWYTGPDGKKVYISNNGQELTGRIAYMHYRKESGAGFKRSKKKTAAKNTSQKKKPAARRKPAAKRK
ncbi:hypothetical protein RHMOL_Rhmol04G0022300 [Rhododendron molle]|uniref:Uncharacterized protein n=1 Tax=Rhododendron molle TaxID=49168 RepID=A0ACC0NXG5_RHOML|nr:hypothetical protein RHMOL_Rhmol04G0022300 [Rhododendron molle]